MTTWKNIVFNLLCFVLTGCADLMVHPSGTNSNYEDFSSIGQLVQSRYAFLQYKHINWDSLVAVYNPQVAEAHGDEIYPVFHRLLGELKDIHVELQTEGGYAVITYDWPRRQNGKAYSPLVVRNYFDKELRLAGNNYMEYEILPGNIGYVYISTFHEGNWINDFDGILDYLKNTKGIILDVRNNAGGSGSTCDFIISRFITTPINDVVYMPNGAIGYSVAIKPRGSFQYQNPVVILINGASVSAAELFPSRMKNIPTVTMVGDTTAGGGGSADVFTLPSKKRIQLAIMYFKRFDGAMVEGNGVVPDILVPQTEDDIKQGRDKQLERAIELLQ